MNWNGETAVELVLRFLALDPVCRDPKPKGDPPRVMEVGMNTQLLQHLSL